MWQKFAQKQCTVKEVCCDVMKEMLQAGGQSSQALLTSSPGHGALPGSWQNPGSRGVQLPGRELGGGVQVAGVFLVRTVLYVLYSSR